MTKLRVCSLFTGIGGLELGLSAANFTSVLFCDNDPAARAVLKTRFSNVEIAPDVIQLRNLPPCDVITGGWPCQDLSQAGSVRGMAGSRSSLVSEVFRLIRTAHAKPRFVLLENVAFALHLHGGDAISHVTQELSDLGYRWAYRVLDTQYFGLPQRRRRLFILASLDLDPAQILFEPTAPMQEIENPRSVGFYWTEGNRGVGWSPEAVPPLKGGSAFSIPSPPAIWDRTTGEFSVPGVVDAERLQGFPSDWTLVTEDAQFAHRARWRLIGNAVSVPVVEWLARRLSHAIEGNSLDYELRPAGGTKEHNAAFGGAYGAQYFRTFSEGPARRVFSRISEFEFRDRKALSHRAALGFLRRLTASRLAKNAEFIRDLRGYCASNDRATANIAA